MALELDRLTAVRDETPRQHVEDKTEGGVNLQGHRERKKNSWKELMKSGSMRGGRPSRAGSANLQWRKQNKERKWEDPWDRALERLGN